MINGKVPASLRQHWQHISYVKQQTFLFHDTILRNITLEDETVRMEKLQKVIQEAGLMDLIDSFPDGLNRIIMENGKNISGGQRQRIALARALYRDASLFILDEPFNELDENAEWALLTIMKKIADSGRMVILVTHHSKSLSFCNKTVSLDA
jgi:ABC-type bacteriocin/lantibiotic exporter with double-glycine peptidase domain